MDYAIINRKIETVDIQCALSVVEYERHEAIRNSLKLVAKRLGENYHHHEMKATYYPDYSALRYWAKSYEHMTIVLTKNGVVVHYVSFDDPRYSLK